MKFYFQYDKERHKAKVVIDDSPDHHDIHYVDNLIVEVPIHSVLQKESPQFVMRGQCKYFYFTSNSIKLTNKK